jgi:hypothetical protein
MTDQSENQRNREYWGQESELAAPMAYERRFVAYVDILGWKDACCDSRRHAEVFAVAKMLSELPPNFSRDMKETLNHTKGAAPDPSHRETEVVTFSDNLVISTPIDLGYTLLFKFLTFVCLDLLTQGFLTRGGVAVGELCHKENLVFGPALIEAVAMEKEAIYPRLLCSQALAETIRRGPNCEPCDTQAIINDHLGRSVVNLLAYYPAAWHDPERKITDTIKAGVLQESRLEKWQYMHDVFEKMIQGVSKTLTRLTQRNRPSRHRYVSGPHIKEPLTKPRF